MKVGMTVVIIIAFSILQRDLRPVYSDAIQLASAGRYRHFADATQLNSTSS